MIEERMNAEEALITQEGYNKVEEELEYLKATKRLEVAERIKVALSFGDISENAEYDEAKNEQAQLEERISKLEKILRTAVIVDESKMAADEVNFGSHVKIDIDGEIEEYTIVGASEADPLEGKISNESPLGRAIIKKTIGDIVFVDVPDGTVKAKIIDVKR